MKVHRVMQGEWGSCLFSCNFCPHSALIFPSPAMEDHIENRRGFTAGDRQPLQPIEGVGYYALVQSPIISSGDVCGSVMFLQNKETTVPVRRSKS